MDQPKQIALKDQNDGLKIKNVATADSKKVKDIKNGAEQKLQENIKKHLSLTVVDSEQVQISKPNNLGKNKAGDVKLQPVTTKEDKEDAEKDNNTKETKEENQAKMKNEATTISNSNNERDDKIHDKKHDSVDNKEGKFMALQNEKTKKVQMEFEEHLSLTGVDSERDRFLKPNNLGKNEGGELVKPQPVKTKEDKEDAEKDNNTKETEEKNQAKLKKKNEATTVSNSNIERDDKSHDKKNDSVDNTNGKVMVQQNEETKKVQMEDKKVGGEEKKKEVSGNSEREEDINDKKNMSPLQHLQSNKWIWLGALGSLLVLVAGAVLKVMNTQKKSQTGKQEQQTSRTAENKETEK